MASISLQVFIIILILVLLGLQIYFMLRIKSEAEKSKIEFKKKEEEAAKLLDIAKCKLCGLCEYSFAGQKPFEKLCDPEYKCETC